MADCNTCQGLKSVATTTKDHDGEAIEIACPECEPSPNIFRVAPGTNVASILDRLGGPRSKGTVTVSGVVVVSLSDPTTDPQIVLQRGSITCDLERKTTITVEPPPIQSYRTYSKPNKG